MNKETQSYYVKCSLMLSRSIPLTKQSNLSKSFLSTAEDTQKKSTPRNDNYNKLYQQYIQSKNKRKNSKYCSDILLSQLNVFQKEKEIATQRLNFLYKRINKKANGGFNLLLAKEDRKTCQLMKEQQLEELQERNSRMKHKRDFTIRTWKERIKTKNKTQSFHINLIKHKLESDRSINKFNEIIQHKESCLENRVIRVLSAENRLKNKLSKSNYQLTQLKNKISFGNQIKQNYDKDIIRYKNRKNELILDIEKINKENRLLAKVLL